jgi:lysophospholipase L1-like esterase
MTARIFCYGDSLTAGTSDSPFELFPYAPHLEKMLNEDPDAPSSKTSFVVRHRGLPGWTAKEMVRVVDGPQNGLRTIIKGIQNPSLSCVIILAGTNDVGYAMSTGDDHNSILSDVTALHEMVWNEGIRTIAVGIPDSAYQSKVTDAKALVENVNGQLRIFCEQQANQQATFVEFPFNYQPDGENWASDGLHFSPKGYETLGRHLAEPVRKIVLSITETHAS